MNFLIILLSGLLIGWFFEFFYKFFDKKKVIFPRLINIQMYLLTAIFCYILYLYNFPILSVVFAIFIFTTGIEFLTGYLSFKISGIIPWDYSHYKYNFQKLICLPFSLCWLLIGIIYYYFILPILLNLTF